MTLESTLATLFPPVELDAETKQRILDRVKVYVPDLKLVNEKQSSKVYGNCEKCKEYCSEVWHLFGWNGKKYVDLFGHLECCKRLKSEIPT